jgi:NMD protein affecting ribosome stability and mRNA decay
MVRSLVGKHDKYFEGILQLRNVNQKIVEFVEDDLKNGHIAVSQVKKVKNGFDFYLSDNDYTRALANRLQKKFGGELKFSSSLHTKVKGKDAYRMTALFRYPAFAKGDIVDFGGDIFKVKTMGKDIVLIGQGKNTKKLHLRYRDMTQIKKVDSDL